MRLSDSFDIKINWCLLEIHPETSCQGEAIDSLDYLSDTWNTMMRGLERIASEENIDLKPISFITNSNNAQRISEAAKTAGRQTFYALHEALFSAYFIDGLNIADRQLLKTLAETCGLSSKTVEAAWSDKKISQRLQHNYIEARKFNIQSVPAFVFGNTVLTGVVEESRLRQAAQQMLETQ